MRTSKILFFLLITMYLFSCREKNKEEQNSSNVLDVKFQKKGDQFILLRGGDPYFIKGARTLGTRYMDKVAEYGGNSVRIGYNEDVKQVLDEAQRLGLSVLFGLPVRAERSGFDYDDDSQVRAQYDKVREIVDKFKDHPAVLMWVIGNELDHIPGDKDYNLKMWDAVNDIASMIHKIDPAHPAMTVIGTGEKEKLKDLIERCPDLDILGVNAYADIWEIPDWVRQYGWNRPYAVTEWGPSGHWQVPRTKWGVVIEETSTEKARVYKERYEKMIKTDPWCVGSYVFLWTSNRQERTHTWYNMFHDDGAEKEAVEVMNYEWTGYWPDNRCPQIDSLQIDKMNALDNIGLQAGSLHTVNVTIHDPDMDELEISWELLPENKKFGAYAGQGETKPPAVEGVFKGTGNQGRSLKFVTPGEKGGNFRMFVYVHDGHDNIAVANIPFHIIE